jgi:hypothetical protein
MNAIEHLDVLERVLKLKGAGTSRPEARREEIKLRGDVHDPRFIWCHVEF